MKNQKNYKLTVRTKEGKIISSNYVVDAIKDAIDNSDQEYPESEITSLRLVGEVKVA